VDMIIGGHSHTILEKPAQVNKILIAQAGVGTDQIGRFDIVIDDDTNSIVDFKWQLIPINEDLAPRDEKLEEYINQYKNEVDRKYGTIICKLQQQLTHPKREEETTLGNLLADAFAERSETDVMLVGSGSIRVKEMGPVVTLKDLIACFPYDDALTRFVITGKQLKKIFSWIMRVENRNSEGECYQVNSGVKAVYNDKKHALVSLSVKGKTVLDNKNYSICMQNYHFSSSKEYLGVTNEELLKSGKSKVITTSAQQVLEEYLRSNQLINKKIKERLIYI